MMNLHQIENWRNSLGLLPIKLFITEKTNPNSYILLNGGQGDFCLELNPENEDNTTYFANSWSSDTKNFVTLKDDFIKIYNWQINKHDPETIKKDIVENNLNKFYSYLIQKSYKNTTDIVPFVLKIYRKLRNLINEDKAGSKSLKLLLLLLAIYEEQRSINDIDKEKWGITDLNFHIPEIEFEKYLAEFSEGIYGKIKPNVELILRHASGSLFQEAHYEAMLFNADKNLDLFTGTISDLYETQKVLYSSFHYTPAYLARTIVENSLKNINLNEKEHLKIFDPACGTSEFLLEALKQLKTKGYTGTVEIIGWDSSDIAIHTSNFLLNYEKREWNEKLNINLELVSDSLTKDWDSDYDLILMNPPFRSWEQMSKTQRVSIRESLSKLFTKRPNQASAFVWKSAQAIKDAGVIGCVLPSSLLNYDSYVKLRNELLQIISPLLIGKLGNYIFENALTDVSFFIGRKPKENISPLILWTKNEKGIASDAIRDLRLLHYSNIPAIVKNNYSIYSPITFPINNENWKLLSYKEEKLLQKLESTKIEGKLKSVQNIFTVKQGIRTGYNNVFKLSNSQFYELPQNEQIYFRPVVDNDAIKNGQLIEVNYVWFPYSHDGSLFKSEQELQEKSEYFYTHALLPYKSRLQARSGIVEWWNLTRPRNWQFIKFPKIVSTEFGKSGSFAFDKNGKFVVERGMGWIPKKKVEDTDFYYFYLAVFSSHFFDTLLSIYSKQLAGGKWWDLGQKFTKNIPIPYFSSEIKGLSAFHELIEFGKEISAGERYNFEIIDEHLSETFYTGFDEIV